LGAKIGDLHAKDSSSFRNGLIAQTRSDEVPHRQCI